MKLPVKETSFQKVTSHQAFPYPNVKKVYVFFNLTIRRTSSRDELRWYHSAVVIGIFNRVLQIAYCWLGRPQCICLEQTSIRKHPKDFEVGGFPCCILNNTHFFRKWSQKVKKIHDIRKSSNIKQNSLCRRYHFMMRVMYTKYTMYTKLQNYSL